MENQGHLLRSGSSRVRVWWTSKAGDAPSAAEGGEPPGAEGKMREITGWWDWFLKIYDDIYGDI